MDEDEQFNQAFGEHTDIDEEVQAFIKDIKDNNSDVDKIVLRSYDTDEFTDLAWTLLGRYIANNTHLKTIDVDECHLTNEQMELLFKELVGSISLERLDLDDNDFGIDGLRTMIPLLQNSPTLSILYLAGNRHFGSESECFELLLNALNGTSVKMLYLQDNNIEDISAFDRYILPNLDTLNLNENKIGREGCITLSNLLQKEGSKLTRLCLDSTDIENEGAEILSNSLKHNTKLEILELNRNDITARGYKAFLKVLVDISSIESTHTSNHTLTTCMLDRCADTDDNILDARYDACRDNGRSSNPEATGRAKVIKYHLNSQNRKKLCAIQGIEYTPGSIFADIEPVLLPKVLWLIGNEHGQSELYTALVHTAPELLSYVDRKALLDDKMAKNTAQITALNQQLSILNAENAILSKRREMIDIGDSKQQAGGEGNSRKVGDKKRKIQH